MPRTNAGAKLRLPTPVALAMMTRKRFALSGAACCITSALAYTASAVCMRRLADLHCDAFWAILSREAVTSILVLPWLAWLGVRGRPALPSGRLLVRLLITGLLVETIGNVGVQWSLGVVGLAVTIPVQFGFMIVGGAILGRAALGERVSLRTTAAVAVLLASLVLLNVGAGSVARSIAAKATPPGLWTLALAVGATGTAGVIYALLSTVVRHSVLRDVSPAAVAFLIPVMAVVGLGPICVVRPGLPALLATPGEQLALMAAAGVFNLLGFLAIIYGLQRTTVVHANVLNASQVAMASAAGMILFHESPNPWVLSGICLTVLGIVWIDRPPEALDEIPPP